MRLRPFIFGAVLIIAAQASSFGQNPVYAVATPGLSNSSAYAVPSTPSADDPNETVLTIRKRVDEVNVIFTVTDKRGRFVKNLTKIFSGLKAVDNVSFELERGRIYAFVGPNGAGKTTTMRMIATLEEPTAGEITVNGLSVYENPYAIRRMLGYMPDHYGTYPDMTTRDYLEFYARAYELERSQRSSRVEAIMEFTGEGCVDAFP